MTDCGSGGSGTESCCTSLEVPGGTFYRIALDGAVDTAGSPSTVSGFRLDKYLVTVGRFRQYVNYITGPTGAPPASGSGKHTHLHGGRGLVNESVSPSQGAAVTYETGWDSTDWDANLAPDGVSWNALVNDFWPTTAGSPENLPVTQVNWYEAYAFCIWDGGFLPTDTEWSYAAQGGSQERAYPWGSMGPDTDAGSNEPAAWNPQYAITSCDYPAASACVSASAACGPSSCGYFNLGCGQQIYCGQGCVTLASAGSCSVAAVGTASLGAGYWGQLDLVGEALQWTLDVAPAAYPCPGDDCAFLGPSPVLPVSNNRAVRGCEYLSPCVPLAPQAAPADNFDIYKGFRCARTP
jgi:formylglycine-generating enzyme required for sulfatase activity